MSVQQIRPCRDILPNKFCQGLPVKPLTRAFVRGATTGLEYLQNIIHDQSHKKGQCNLAYGFHSTVSLTGVAASVEIGPWPERLGGVFGSSAWAGVNLL